jgi:GNAT superfamily N-acetyltransferase
MIALRAATRADIPALSRLVRRCDESHRAWAGPDLPMPDPDGEELEWDLRFARSGSWIQVAVDDALAEQPRAAASPAPATPGAAAAPGGGAVVGAIAFAQATVSRDDRTPVAGLGHVSAVFVDPDHWRRGIARRMLAAAEEAMRVAGHDRAQLWTLEGSPAEQLYAALGWSRDGRRDTFPPMGLATVAYVKPL